MKNFIVVCLLAAIGAVVFIEQAHAQNPPRAGLAQHSLLRFN